MFIAFYTIFNICIFEYISKNTNFHINIDIIPLCTSSICAFATHYMYFMTPNMYWNIYMYQNDDIPIYSKIVTEMLYGYSIYEIFDFWRTRRIDFLIHGLSLFIMFSHMYWLGMIHTVFPALITETSSIILSFRKGENKKKLWVNIGFVLLFFIYKLCVFPYMLYHSIIDDRNPVRVYTLIYGAPFIILNIYWGYLIVCNVWKRIKYKNE